MKKRKPHELIGFLAIYAVRYAEDFGLDGLHPTHYDLMKKYGARMVSFKRATLPRWRPANDQANAGSVR